MEASIYRMRLRDILTACVLALLSLGVVMVQSASTSLSGSITRAGARDLDTVHGPGPEAVAEFCASMGPDGIELSWDVDTNPSTTAYRIYRSDSADKGYALLQTVRQPHTRYRDESAPPGEMRYYRIAAVDDLSREGPRVQLNGTRPSKWFWTPLAAKHLSYVGVALLVFFVIGKVDYAKFMASDRLWTSPVLWAAALAALACIGVLVPGVGSSVNGARRWIKLGPIQVQPSELAKWATVLFLAWWLTRPKTDPANLFRGFVPALIPVVALCLLVVIQDFGTAALIAVCALTMLLAGRVKWRHVALVAIPAVAAAVWFIAHKSYRMRRIMAFRDPYASPQGEGYHMIQSLLSFSTGGLFGRGLGNGIQKLGYLPEDTTDFIFAVICEELGLFGAMLVVAMYLGVIYVAWQVVKQKRDDFGRLLAFGIGSMLGLQAAINIAVATVSVPTKGLSLPLVSAGGSGLVITCAALGMLYSVSRSDPEEVEAALREAAPPVRERPRPRLSLGASVSSA